MRQLVFDTRQFPVEERFRLWSAGLSDFRVEQVDPHQPFDAVSTVTGLGPLPISESVLPALRFLRDRDMIQARRSDYWNLNLMLEGVLQLNADGHRYEVGPGVPVLLDLSRPVEIVAGPVRSIVVVLPRNLLGAGRRGGAHGPLPPSAESELLASYLTALCASLPRLEDTSAAQAARALCELVSACLPAAGRVRPTALRGEALRLRVLEFVDQHVSEPISIERLCDALAVSRSALYRALTFDGGVAELVRRVRLEAAHRLLSDRTELRAISQIAGAVGFADEALFSRHFRTLYGYTASELRSRAAAPSALDPAIDDPAIAYARAVNRLAFGPDEV